MGAFVILLPQAYDSSLCVVEVYSWCDYHYGVVDGGLPIGVSFELRVATDRHAARVRVQIV
jgi:hypothetical protein